MKPSASLFTFVLIPLVIQALPIPGGGASGTVAVGLAGQILSAIIANLPAIIQLVTTILSAGGAKPAGLISSNLALGPLLTPDIINGSLKVIQGAIDATEAAASAGTDQTAIIASALGVISNPTIINGAGQLLQGAVAGTLGALANPQTLSELGQIMQDIIAVPVGTQTAQQVIQDVLEILKKPNTVQLLQSIVASASSSTKSVIPKRGFEEESQQKEVI